MENVAYWGLPFVRDEGCDLIRPVTRAELALWFMPDGPLAGEVP